MVRFVLTRLYLQNFRAFEQLDIRLTKINCFLRPNDSGKSAILSAINVLSQTIDNNDRDVSLLLNGKFEDLGTYRDTVFNNDLSRDTKIGLEFAKNTKQPSDEISLFARSEI